MTKVFIGGAVGTAVMTFMMCFVRPIIVGEAMDIADKVGAMMGELGAGNGYTPNDRSYICPNDLCDGFL
jgi:hypothetical protein